MNRVDILNKEAPGKKFRRFFIWLAVVLLVLLDVLFFRAALFFDWFSERISRCADKLEKALM